MRFAFLSLVVITFLGACVEFEENFVEINNDPKVIVEGLTLTDAQGQILNDTFSITGPTTVINYAVNVANADTVAIYVSSNRTYITSISNFSQGSFTLHTDRHDDGIHDLTFEVTTNTGTGSMADLSSEELISTKITRYFSITSHPARANRILSVRPDEGTLKIEWEEDPNSQKRLEFSNSFPFNTWEVAITDPHQTSFVDEHYIGGNLTVRLVTLGTRSTDASAATTSSIIVTAPVIKEFSNDELGNLTIKWNKSPLYNNISKYVLRNQGIIIKSTADGSDTTLITNKIPFGQQPHVTLYTYAKKLIRTDTVRLSSSTNVFVGENLPYSLYGMVHAPLTPEKGFCIDYNNEELYVLNGDIVEAKYPIPLWVNFFAGVTTADGTALYYADKGYIYKVDRNGNYSVVINTSSVYGEVLTMNRLTLGDDRYLTFRADGTLYMYDLVSQQRLFERTVSNNSGVYQTPDGRFLVEKATSLLHVHALVDGKITATNSIELPTKSVFIDVLHGNKIVGISPSTIYSYDPYKNELIQQDLINSDLTNESSYVYDAVTGLAGTEYLDQFIVVDLIKREIIRKTTTLKSPGSFALYNGALYFYHRKLDLKLD